MSTQKKSVLGILENNVFSEEEKGTEIAAERINDMLDKTHRAMAAALRLASLCYNSEEIKRLASLDKYGDRWMNEITEGLCALSRIDTKMKERLYLSIRKSPELYNILDMDEHISELEET